MGIFDIFSNKSSGEEAPQQFIQPKRKPAAAARKAGFPYNAAAKPDFDKLQELLLAMAGAVLKINAQTSYCAFYETSGLVETSVSVARDKEENFNDDLFAEDVGHFYLYSDTEEHYDAAEEKAFYRDAVAKAEKTLARLEEFLLPNS
jgi:hypothetical protein